jgi:thymidylate kinase
MDNRGCLIVLEGQNTPAKTKLCSEIINEVELDEGWSFIITGFPQYDSKIGKILEEFIQGTICLESHAAALLFAANRWESMEQILKHLNNKCHVLIDQYAYSGVAHSIAHGLPASWAKGIERGLPNPTLVLYMETPEWSDDSIILEKTNLMLTNGATGTNIVKKPSFLGDIEFQSDVKKGLNSLCETRWIILNDQDPEKCLEEAISAIHAVIYNNEHGRRKLGYRGLFTSRSEMEPVYYDLI